MMTDPDRSTPPTLSPDQAAALEALHAFVGSDRPALALSGPAGTGKSFLIGRFLRELDTPVHLTATTHKAAKVVADLAGGAAMTVHSLFGLRPVNDHQTGQTRLEPCKPPKAEPGRLVIVDEASMVDDALLLTLAKSAKALGLQLLFVGDPYQLPPVAEAAATPAVFRRVQTLSLTTVHRQAAGSPIIDLATAFRRVLDGEPYPVIREAGAAVRRVDRAAFGGLVRELFTSREYRQDANHVRLVAWTNARVEALNRYVRHLLLGAEAERSPFLPGETLIVNEAVTENEEVLLPNEAIVTVQEAKPGHFQEMLGGYWLMVADHEGGRHRLFAPADRQAAGRYLAVLRRQAQSLRALGEADDRAVRAAWRAYFEAKEAFADLRPPHACTVHKSQGSTYRHVLVQAEDIGRAVGQPGDLLARLLYVALTRAAESAVVYGELPGAVYRQAA
ncbi:MAG: hypothetical protein EOM21_13020 [Gammaproteobacteria bacterium]|nr:hypothetical protein [Gammaproteobacteria bacterium]